MIFDCGNKCRVEGGFSGANARLPFWPLLNSLLGHVSTLDKTSRAKSTNKRGRRSFL